MLENRDIVCVGLPTWEGPYMKAVVQLMTALAEHNRVLYVDYPHSVKDVAATALGRSRAPIGRILGLEPRLRAMRPAADRVVHVLTPPPVLPANGLPSGPLYDRVLRLNGRLVEGSIRAAMAHLGMRDPMVVNAFNPFLGVPLAGRLGESSLVYYCYDEITATGWNARHGTALEETLIRKADVVITTSRALQASRSCINPNCQVVENGVDFDLFHRAFTMEAPAGARPTAGFIGSLDFRVDYDLLERVCLAATDIDFVFVGRILSTEACRRLDRLPNVTFTGAKAPDSLPGALGGMHVGMIPFVQNEFTRNIYPLKINEYLAGGRAVVMTDFAELEGFDGLVSVVRGADAFVAALRSELRQDTPDRRRARARVAESNAWPARARAFGQAVLSFSPSKAHA